MRETHGIPDMASITLEQRAKITQIENSPLANPDKISLLLLILNRKYVAQIGFRRPVTTDNRALLESKLSETKAIGTVLDLQMHNSGVVNDPHTSYTPKLYFSVELSRELNFLLEFQQALREQDNARIGKLLGYPDTATKWYSSIEQPTASEMDDFILSNKARGMTDINLQRMLSQRFPSAKEPDGSEEVIRSEGLRPFLDFRLSPDHWRQELESVRKIRDLIKSASPRIYEEAVALYKNAAN